MWIWITLGILIVIVVIGFLLGIASALESIERGLAEADHAVTGAKGDVVPLPTHIERINAALGRADDDDRGQAALDPRDARLRRGIAREHGWLARRYGGLAPRHFRLTGRYGG